MLGRRLSVVVGIFFISNCATPKQTNKAPGSIESNKSAERSEAQTVQLLDRSLIKVSDGSLQIRGHWKLKESEDPLKPKVPVASQPLNAVLLRCWPEKGQCAEYGAQVAMGILSTVDPVIYEVESWDANRIVARMGFGPDAQITVFIDIANEHIEMEYRRDPSPGRSRIFERYVLE